MNNRNPDRIEGTPGGGVAFVGPKAVDVFRMITLRHALLGWPKRIRTRGVTLRRLMDMATSYTGTVYPRNAAGCGLAAEDMAQAIDKARADLG